METQSDKPSETTKGKQAETPATKEKPQENKSKEKLETKSTTPKIDSFIKFKAPSKSKKKTTKEAPKTPVKIDVLEDTAMPSWSDNSNNEIIRPKETEPMEVDKPEIMIIEDSEDVKLVYEDSEDIKLVYEDTLDPESDPSPKTESPKSASNSTNTSENTFMKTAKVTDIKEAVQVKAAPSPKAPRRVNFVTLSSPKNKKKL